MERYAVEDLLGKLSREEYRGSLGTIPYRLFIPDDGGKGKPVVLFMHGAGERGTDNELPLRTALEAFVKSNEVVKNAIFIIPQCPAEEQWVMTPWSKVSYSVDDIPESWEIKTVLEILEKVVSENDADRDRIYVMGLSMGGFATWDLVMRHGELFAAAMPICGGADPTKADKVKDIPIRTFHGDVDEEVPVDGTRAMVAAIRALGGSIEYTEYHGLGHGIWDLACSSEGVGDWMFSKRLSDRM